MLTYTFDVTYVKVGEVQRADTCPAYEFKSEIAEKFLKEKLSENGIKLDLWRVSPDAVSAWQRQITFSEVEAEE